MKTSTLPPQPSSETRRTPLAESRGSVLMVALILAGVIAISLTSFMQLATHASKMSLRTFYMNEAQNLNDIGLEHALWSMNNNVWTTGNTYTTTLGTYALSNNVTGVVKVWADLSNASKPHVVVKATVTLTDGSTVDKVSEAYIKASSWFDDGMVGETITIGSNTKLNSYSSIVTVGNTTTVQGYSSAVADDNITVAALNAGSGTLQNAGLIYGSISTGASDDTGFNNTRQGIVGNTTYVNTAANRGTIQDGNATYDFTASFPDVTAPTAPSGSSYVLGAINTDLTLPRTSPFDVPQADGNYYYDLSSLNLSGSEKLNITSGNVIIVTSGNISLSGQAELNISTGARLKLYTSGSVDLSGNGVTNGATGNVTAASQPINFQLYGTAPSGGSDQSITVKGNGYLSGVIYAPNGNVTISGGGANGDVLGAVVANTVTTNGNVSFHYDESLPNSLTNGLWKLKKWRDLTNASDRATWESYVSF